MTPHFFRKQLQRIRRIKPFSFARNSDRNNLVLIFINLLDNRHRRADRDFVFAGAPAENHADSDFFHTIYKSVLPKADRISTPASSTVILPESISGLTSTTSNERMPPAWATISSPRCASR